MLNKLLMVSDNHPGHIHEWSNVRSIHDFHWWFAAYPLIFQSTTSIRYFCFHHVSVHDLACLESFFDEWTAHLRTIVIWSIDRIRTIQISISLALITSTRACCIEYCSLKFDFLPFCSVGEGNQISMIVL